MERISEVEAARALMNEAATWSVMKWLREKKRVRRTADQANAALDQMNQLTKNRWPGGVRAAYELLAAQSGNGISARDELNQSFPVPDSETKRIAQKVKEADQESFCARMDAERIFDEAEKQLSTRLAREGCRRAIQSWDLQEKAIRKAEDIIPLTRRLNGKTAD